MLEESEDHTLPRITAAQLKLFETRNKIVFPEPLRSALLKLNGGAFESNIFKFGDTIYVIHGFRGLNLKAKASRALHPVSDYKQTCGLSQEFIKKTGDPEKIFLFDNEYPLAWYWALNFNSSATDPSIWMVEPNDVESSWKVFENWQHLESCKYEGEETSSVDLEKWPEGEVMIDDHGHGTMCRQRLVLRNGVACLQHEHTWTDEVSRSEFCFKPSTINHESLTMRHERDETPKIRIAFNAPAASRQNSELLGDRWVNGMRYLNSPSPESESGGYIWFQSVDNALRMFRFLASSST